MPECQLISPNPGGQLSGMRGQLNRNRGSINFGIYSKSPLADFSKVKTLVAIMGIIISMSGCIDY